MSTTPYRTYLNKSLNRLELSHVNNSAPDNMKYCNFLCQEYVLITDFAKKGEKTGSFCKKCTNYYNLVIKQVKDKTITVEQFKENSNIVYGNEVISISTKKCKNCKQDKSIDFFEAGRQKCKECRQIEATQRNNNIGSYIKDIDSKKNNPGELEKVVKLIPKDKLIQIISHYEVGRKSSDTKDIMVKNVVDHFTKLLDPWICRGRCGNKLTIQFHTCDGCIRKIVSTKRTLEEFKEKNLPEFIEKLEVITEADEHNFNKEELNTICKELKLPVKQKMTKEMVLKLINDEVKILKEQREKQKFLEENNLLFETPKHNGEICLNGIFVLSREDGYINATQLCKAGGKKKFNDWSRMTSTNELIDTLESVTGIPVTELIDTIQGGNPKLQGSWIHPDLAVQLAQWISPKFAIQVSRWIRELALTGSVTIGNEKTNLQLLETHRKLIETQNSLKLIENKHNVMLRKMNYYKFKQGPGFYIISDIESGVNKKKPGIDTKNVNVRLEQHRSTVPGCRLEFLCYTNDCKLIEDNILKRYEHCRKYLNHEWVYDIDTNHIIESVKTLINFLGIDVEIETNLEPYNQQIEIHE